MSVVPTNIAVSTTVPALTLAAGTTGGVAAANSIDGANDYLLIYTNSATATQGINRQTLLGVVGQPVDISSAQSLTNKTFNNTNAYTTKDTSFTLQNASSVTKQAQFLLSSITAGQTRIFTLPDYNATVATIAGTETLTNKTLTSPTINTPTISNATMSIDTITGYSSSTSGTFYGIAIASGVITTTTALGANTVTTSSIANAAVTPSKLGIGAETSVVATSQTTSSTSYTALSTAQSVTVTIGVNGLLLLGYGSTTHNDTAAGFTFMSIVLSGANTLAANDDNAALSQDANANVYHTSSRTLLLTGLTAGSTTVALNFKVATGGSGAGTGTWYNRSLWAVPL